MIRTSQPVIKVTLIKTIRRRDGLSQRYQGAGKRLDLEKFLNDSSSVITRKNINQSVGSFTITLADKQVQPEKGAFQDSLYGWIEPMDAIEIRMGRDLPNNTDDDIPIIMRGFVSSIRHSQSMGTNGEPARTVVIEGHDYGKLLNIIQIFYQKTYALGIDLLTDFLLDSNYDVKTTERTPAEFVATITEKIVNKHLRQLQNDSLLEVTPKIIPDTAGVPVGGIILPIGYQGFEGTLWELLRRWTDRYWNELFIEDREDGVYLVCREMPYKDISGKYINTQYEKSSLTPKHVDISNVHIKSQDIRRSDSNVANFYWVSAPRSLLIDQAVVQMDAYQKKDNFYIPDYANTDLDLYGIRKMEVQTEQGRAVNGHKEVEYEKRKLEMDNWVGSRVRLLKAFNKDNILWEEGSSTVRGDSEIKPGRYLNFHIGTKNAGYTSTAYCLGVTQEFLPYRSWMAHVEFSRGNGFIKRSEMAGSPYLAERGKGAYE